ncbi:hypothetical protein KVR01_004424 [Diaporthe batatas]|uniref:uncharacterized protein n=1 Tax=Diaporthe batatas TaxID=748121 RepID=UPI001D037FF1|nr:uncharacterized protein KVR01_004424 [Diaporthe batatas]KAG8165872.1 hypothetical protein KVR01_004424 [Diaporthe batatas]
MAPLAGLPDPNTLNVFSYYDPHVDKMIPIVSNDNKHPRVIDDFLVDPSDWEAVSRGGLHYGNRSSSPVGAKTVDEVLGHNTGNLGCFVCGKRGDACHGQACIDIAKDRFRDETDHRLQIRKARWGFGVFAREDIPKGTLIGEYLGRLVPFHPCPRVESAYVYVITGRAECDAETYCNITHFINHNCNCNTNPVTAMYGGRAVVVFSTKREIAAGEEITIDYGPEYFHRDFPCECDAFDYPHTSEAYRRRISPDGNVSPQCVRKSAANRQKALFGPVRKSDRQGGPIPRKQEVGGPESGPGGGAAPAEVPAPRVKRRLTSLGLRSERRPGGWRPQLGRMSWKCSYVLN